MTNRRGQPTQVVFEEWDSYAVERDGTLMFISFDDIVTRDDPPAGLELCARVIIPIQEPNDVGGPVSPEAERLWDLEDKLCNTLSEHAVNCRLVARVTYEGLRELVFQLHDWDSFRPPVGLWMREVEGYEIEVSEHEGWDFFNECVRPTPEDRMWMADRSVIDALLDAGSNPDKPHTLDFAFRGQATGLRNVAQSLVKRGYKALNEPDYASGTIELSKSMMLDLQAINEESKYISALAEESGVEFDGWGAAVVK